MSVTLNCEGVGNEIRYRWEVRHTAEGQWIPISYSQTHVVTNLQNTRQFRCVVCNDAGRDDSNIATVAVLSELTIIGNFIIHVHLLEITTHPQDQLEADGSTISLTCTSSVSSGVTFTWTHNDNDVTRQSTSSGNTSILSITNVMNSDAGRYVCTVRSGSLSVMSNSATVSVYGKYVDIVRNSRKPRTQEHSF